MDATDPHVDMPHYRQRPPDASGEGPVGDPQGMFWVAIGSVKEQGGVRAKVVLSHDYTRLVRASESWFSRNITRHLSAGA